MMALWLLATQATAARAADHGPGDRAPVLESFDVVHGRSAALEDWLGHWVLLDFWATWCGPCVAEMPKVREILRRSGDTYGIRFVTVSLDEAETLPQLRKFIRQEQPGFPILCDRAGWHAPGLAPWRLPKEGIPSQYLINPQGVIVACCDSDSLSQLLEHFVAGEVPPVGLRSSSFLNPDGTATVIAETYSPLHTPLTVELNIVWEKYRTEPDPHGPLFKSRDGDFIRGYSRAVLESGEFGDSTHSFTVVPDAQWDNFRYSLSIDLAPAATPEGEPLRIYCSGTHEFRFSDIRHENGEWRVFPLETPLVN